MLKVIIKYDIEYVPFEKSTTKISKKDKMLAIGLCNDATFKLSQAKNHIILTYLNKYDETKPPEININEIIVFIEKGV